MTSPKPTTMEPSHTTNSMTMATGPTKAITRSGPRRSGGGAGGAGSPPRERATARMARDEVARGTTSAVKRLNAVEPRTRTPTISPTTRRIVSITSSCHVEIEPRRGAVAPGLNGDGLLADEAGQLFGHRGLMRLGVPAGGRRPPAASGQPDHRDEDEHAGHVDPEPVLPLMGGLGGALLERLQRRLVA